MNKRELAKFQKQLNWEIENPLDAKYLVAKGVSNYFKNQFEDGLYSLGQDIELSSIKEIVHSNIKVAVLNLLTNIFINLDGKGVSLCCEETCDQLVHVPWEELFNVYIQDDVYVFEDWSQETLVAIKLAIELNLRRRKRGR